MKSRTSGPVIRFAAPLRALLSRFSFLLLLLVSIAILMAGRIGALPVETMRSRVVDAFAPVLEAISRPAATAANLIESVVDFGNVYEENKRIKTENARLLQWKQAALRLEAENLSLRSLVNATAEPPLSMVTGRVIAAPGSSFVRTLVVMAGERDGVKRGQAAVVGAGIIGRVIEVGQWSSRILLLTDLSSRVPVVLETSRQRAVMSGDNSDQPRLLYLPPDFPVTIGERVVTSGHGGVLPPGIPVGIISAIGERGVRVQPNADLSRLEHVQIIDFGLPGSSVDLVAEGK